jgi:hypothetical protein
VPLYFADNVVALGITRLLMGVPLYALALWLAWLISRPAAGVEVPATAPAAAGPAATGPSSETTAP